MSLFSCHNITAEKILNLLNTRDGILCIGQPQIGKTSIIASLVKNNKYNHTYVITGLSSSDWKKQTINRLSNISDNCYIYHLNDLMKIQFFDNSLIIIDECHMACQINQSIDESLKKTNISKLVFISATPNVIHKNSEDNNYGIVFVDEPEKYNSIEKMLKNGIIKDGKNLIDQIFI